MSAKYDLNITLSKKDIQMIVAAHVNQNLGSDFKVHCDGVKFEIMKSSGTDSMGELMFLKEVKVHADFIPKSNRSIR